MKTIDDLINENSGNWFKLLTIVGNNPLKVENLLSYLKKDNWEIYDVEEKVLELADKIPPQKIKLRIGSELKRWVKSLEDNIILVNSNILYSEEMGKIGPLGAFKYNMRGDKKGIIFIEGKLRGNMAIYSTPDRPDYFETDLSDVLYVDLEQISVPGDEHDKN